MASLRRHPVKLGETTVRISVYRNMENRQAGEPDDGPMAWQAHRERRKVVREATSNRAFNVLRNADAEDDTRTHELADVILEIIKNPTTSLAFSAAAVFVLKTLAKPVDDAISRGVAYLFEKLFRPFKKKRIGDFWITLPDGSKVQVDPNATVTVTLENGKVKKFEGGAADAPIRPTTAK